MIFFCYELIVCPLIFKSNKVYFASSLIAKPNKDAIVISDFSSPNIFLRLPRHCVPDAKQITSLFVAIKPNKGNRYLWKHMYITLGFISIVLGWRIDYKKLWSWRSQFVINRYICFFFLNSVLKFWKSKLSLLRFTS